MGTDRKLDDASEDELTAMLAQKRAKKFAGQSLYVAEEAMAVATQRDEQQALQAVFDQATRHQDGSAKPCPRCRKMIRIARKNVERRVQSLGGEVILRRHYHRCDVCTLGFYPLDLQLQLAEEGECSARLEKLILDFGLHGTFESAAQRFAMHHGIAISENLVRLVVERLGRRAVSDKMLPQRLRVVAATPPTLLLIAADGSMLSTRGDDPWRETKLGMVVRGEHCSDGKDRGYISEARFVARMTGVAEFRQDLTRLISLERGWDCPHVAFLGDGAPWIWNMASEICPNAVQILDFMHAVGAAARPADMLFADDNIMKSVWMDTVSAWLATGRVVELIAQLQQCAFITRGKLRDAFVTAAKYIENNVARMKYDEYRASGLPIGSGMIESAHRYVLQARMKLAGQHWDPQRADRLAQLRAALATCGPINIYDAICA
jgi:hypothetical protein